MIKFVMNNYSDFLIVSELDEGTLREKGPKMEFYMVCIFLYSDSVLSPNKGKYGTEKSVYLDTFHAVVHRCTCNKSKKKC